MNSKKYIANLIITALLIFGSKFFPGFSVISDYGSTILGIFIGVIYGYCTIGLIIPSFMSIVAMSFSSYDTMAGILQKSFGNSTVIYIIAILILSAMIEKCGLADRIVNWIVTRKFAKGKPWVISFMFLFAAYVAAFLLSAIPVIFILWSLLTGLFASVGYKHGDRWPMAMMFGVMFTATLGSCVPSFQISIVSNYGLLSIISDGIYQLQPLYYMMWSLVCSLVLFAIYFMYMKYILKPDVSLLKRDDLIVEDTIPLTWEQKFTGILFTVFVLGLLLPSILPEGLWLKNIFSCMTDTGWSILIVLIGIAVRHNGKPAFDFGEMFSRGVIWDVVLMIATVFMIVGAVTEDRTGISQWVINLISPMQDALNPILFLVLVSFIVLILSNFTNSVAVTYIFIPVLFILSQSSDIGVGMMSFVGCTVFLGNLCFMLPSASIVSAVMYTRPEWIPKKNCVIFSVFSMVVVYLVMLLIGVPLGNLIFE